MATSVREQPKLLQLLSKTIRNLKPNISVRANSSLPLQKLLIRYQALIISGVELNKIGSKCNTIICSGRKPKDS